MKKKLGTVNVAALSAGVGTLFVAIGGAAATGVLGRIERNEAPLLTAAVLAVLLGSAFFVLAGLSVTSGPSELFALLVGTGLTVVGLGWGFLGTIRVGSQRERPAIEVSVTKDGSQLDGKVTAGNLPSNTRMMVFVHGLAKPTKAEDGEEAARSWQTEDVLAQHYVGPDSEGKAAIPIKVPLTSGSYEAVGIRAQTDEDDTTTCASYPVDVPQRPRTDLDGTGMACVVTRLNPGEDSPAPETETPRVALSWAGPGRARAVRATVSTGGTSRQVAITVSRSPGGEEGQLYRAVSGTDGHRRYRAIVRIPASRRTCRICVFASFVDDANNGLPAKRLKCPISTKVKDGQAVAELRRPPL